MENSDEELLAIIRAVIAARRIPKKQLARRCKISRPYFSEMLHGDRGMPARVKERLLAELGLPSRQSEEKD